MVVPTRLFDDLEDGRPDNLGGTLDIPSKGCRYSPSFCTPALSSALSAKRSGFHSPSTTFFSATATPNPSLLSRSNENYLYLSLQSHMSDHSSFCETRSMSSLSSFSSFKSASTTSLCCSVSVLECDIDAHPLSYHESDDESASDDDASFDFSVFSPQPKLASEGSNTDLEFVKASTAAHQRVSKLSLSLSNGNRQGAVKSLSRSSSLSSASSRSLSTIETLESLVPQTKRPASPSSIVSSFLSQSFKKLSDAAAALTASQARQQLLVSAPSGTSPDHALLGFTPRMTDDRLPSIKLTTWKFDETPLLSPCCKPGDKGKKMRSRKNREPRVNSRFLRVYAHDRAAKRDGYLLVPEMNKLVIDMYINNTEDEKRELLHKLTEMSKEKLWSNVILQPRDDPLPPMPYDDDLKNRAPYQNKDIFMSKQSMVRPWGIRRGKTCVQYTVKGWANERWVPKGMSDMVDDDE